LDQTARLGQRVSSILGIVFAVMGAAAPARAAPAPGSLVWYRSDAGVALNGSNVATWADQSGHGNTAWMTTATRQPAYVSNVVNGLPVIRFNGAQSLVFTTAISPQTFTVFVVGKNSMPSETFSMILGPGGSFPNNQLRWENGTQALFVGTGNNLPATTVSIGNTRVNHVLSARFNGSVMNVYRDGSLVASPAFTTSGPWTLDQIGAWYSTYFMQGDLAELIVYASSLSDADMGQTTSYLQSKYALPSSSSGGGAGSVATGTFHSCGITSSGGAKCWGYNANGGLGDGTTTDRATPTAVSGLASGVAAIGVGGYHSCALTTAGGLKCWGNNGNGQVGNGQVGSSVLTPVDVSGLTSGVSAIAGGEFYTCALTTSGGVKCWGDNADGELGDGTQSNRATPVNVSGLTSGVKAIAAGYSHTCALTTSGGVKCWGYNVNGELGIGELGNGTTHPIDRLVPMDVVGLTSGVAAITAGFGSGCALTTSGGVKCWGNGTPSPADVPGLTSGVTAIAANTTATQTCALLTGGSVQCWGDNSHGQLGNGTTTSSSTPVAVSGLTSGVTAIAASGYHTCARTSGGVVCWGDNASGDLGNGSTTQSAVPVSVSGL